MNLLLSVLSGLCLQVKLQRCLPFKHKVSCCPLPPVVTYSLHTQLTNDCSVLCCEIPVFVSMDFGKEKSQGFPNQSLLLLFNKKNLKIIHKLFFSLFSWKFTSLKELTPLKKTVSVAVRVFDYTHLRSIYELLACWFSFSVVFQFS